MVVAPLLLLSACATSSGTGAAAVADGKGGARRGVGGYEVREASEGSDSDSRLQLHLDHGFISQEAAQEAVMRRWKDLSRCHQRAGAATRFAGGPVSLHFVIDPTGRTTDTRVTESRLGNIEVEQCLVTVGLTVVFPRPQGNASAGVDYTLEFKSTGETVVIDLPDSELALQLPRLLGRLATECGGQLGADEVSATLYVAAGGAVRSVGLAAPGELDAAAALCVATTLRRTPISLPVLRSGTIGRITVALRTADLLARAEEVRAVSVRVRPRRHSRR
jgi:hypothetical protein